MRERDAHDILDQIVHHCGAPVINAKDALLKLGGIEMQGLLQGKDMENFIHFFFAFP